MTSKTRALLLTARPKTLSAAVVPVLVASALVKSEGRLVTWWIPVFAILSSIFIQIGTNFVNDALDFVKGADRETRLGEARAAQSGWFSHHAVLMMGLACFASAAVFGLPLVWLGGWPILAIGLVSLVMGYAYTGGPYPLAYVGLGDLFVVIFFGLVAVGGVYYLLTGEYALSSLIAGLQIGMLATVMIAINNLRDLDQDREVGKKTFAVRLGPRRGRLEVLFLFVASFALNLFWMARGNYWAAALPLLAVPIAGRVAVNLLKTEASREYNFLLAKGAAVHMLFGLLISVGFCLA
jgi:1,4-dihydroxy-2-naphthoate octaprenyltransferase